MSASPKPRPKRGKSTARKRGAASKAVRIGASRKRAPVADLELSTEPAERSYLSQSFSDSELLIGLVGAVGTDLKPLITILENRLNIFKYDTTIIKISRDIIPQLEKLPESFSEFDHYQSTTFLMTAGDNARKASGDNSILALGVAARIAADRPNEIDRNEATIRPRHAYIIDSLKHPDEVARLREIYPESFYVIGVHADEVRRVQLLTEEKRMTDEQAQILMARDANENLEHGQRTSDTFQMSDFFVRLDESADRLKQDAWRFLDILFGHPFVTPLFDEFAMFMAFVAALRSADLSRQVGAVVARNQEILSTGANDCPKYGGGLYWPFYDETDRAFKDSEGGRDYTRGVDSNKAEQDKIIENILALSNKNVKNIKKLEDVLRRSRIKDITEYGRIVHAEMEALLACARGNISSVGATLYATTFPCHNCAKHIISCGIKRVVYIEPYPKSKAAEFHGDSLVLGFSNREDVVRFEPFVGVGPRRFFDLFSMNLSSGYPLVRKTKNGKTVIWKAETARLRLQLLPLSYLQVEPLAATMFEKFRQKREG